LALLHKKTGSTLKTKSVSTMVPLQGTECSVLKHRDQMFDRYSKLLHLNTSETVNADDPLFNHMLLHYSLTSAKCELSAASVCHISSPVYSVIASYCISS